MRTADQHLACGLVRQQCCTFLDRLPQRDQPAAQIAERRHHLGLLSVRLQKSDPGTLEFATFHRDPADFVEQLVVILAVVQDGLVGLAQGSVKPRDTRQSP